MSEQSVAEKIRQGGSGMPAYGHTLDDADVADLLSYSRSVGSAKTQTAAPRSGGFLISGVSGATFAL